MNSYYEPELFRPVIYRNDIYKQPDFTAAYDPIIKKQVPSVDEPLRLKHFQIENGQLKRELKKLTGELMSQQEIAKEQKQINDALYQRLVDFRDHNFPERQRDEGGFDEILISFQQELNKLKRLNLVYGDLYRDDYSNGVRVNKAQKIQDLKQQLAASDQVKEQAVKELGDLKMEVTQLQDELTQIREQNRGLNAQITNLSEQKLNIEHDFGAFQKNNTKTLLKEADLAEFRKQLLELVVFCDELGLKVTVGRMCLGEIFHEIKRELRAKLNQRAKTDILLEFLDVI